MCYQDLWNSQPYQKYSTDLKIGTQRQQINPSSHVFKMKGAGFLSLENCHFCFFTFPWIL